jgi:2-(1,2-epoxy-1,2-dihydrophenyl)acetyl-CoA isomerase
VAKNEEEKAMTEPHSKLEIADGIATFTLTRPEARNALSLQVRDEIAEMIAAVRGNDEVKALIIIGSGGVFCAGGDTKVMAGGLGKADQVRSRVLDVHVWLEPLYNLDCPVIAAVDGPAYGGGFSLALVADFIVATTRAQFCAVFGRIGLIPDMAMLYTLPRMVGGQRAKELMCTARAFGAQEAQDMGIVLEVCEPDELMDQARALAGRLAVGSKSAQAATKALVNQSLHQDYRSMAEMEASAQAVCFDSDYHAEAIARFAAKRPLAYDWNKLSKSKEK